MVESMISALLLSLIMVTVVNLTVTAYRGYGQINETSVAVEKSQGANRNLESELTKGFLTILPNDTAPFPVWKTATLGAASNHTNTNSGTTVQTAVYVVYPMTRTLGVYNTTGGVITLSGADAVIDRSKTSPTQSALIYRGNADGSANSSSGTVLWIKKYASGTLASTSILTNKLHKAWNAVNFYRPSARYDSVQMTLITGEQLMGRNWQSNHTTAGTSGVTNVPVRNLVLPNSASSFNVVVP